jgi:hypothetical protein
MSDRLIFVKNINIKQLDGRLKRLYYLIIQVNLIHQISILKSCLTDSIGIILELYHNERFN